MIEEENLEPNHEDVEARARGLMREVVFLTQGYYRAREAMMKKLFELSEESQFSSEVRIHKILEMAKLLVSPLPDFPEELAEHVERDKYDRTVTARLEEHVGNLKMIINRIAERYQDVMGDSLES